jgi:transglutaminase-like putative cysteine protease
MERREFLKSTAAAAAAAALPWRSAQADAAWRTFEVTTRIEVLQARGASRIWLPLPALDTAWQKRLGNAWSGNAARMQTYGDGKYGVYIFYAEWADGAAEPAVELTSRFMTRDHAVDLSRPSPQAERLSGTELALYTAPTELIPTDGIVRDTALAATKGARTDLEKARAIYEWTVENTFRDPKTRGCGWGDIKAMLETGNLGGKCGDINAVFVGLCRAVGVPARDLYGIRVAPSRLGYRSLGANGENISKAQHCRAEFFAQGHGWVPVDPGDVRKVVLEEPPGNLPMDHALVAAARKRLFGSWEMNWLAFNTGHDVALPNSRGPKLAYLMYPNGETGGERLDQLEPDPFRYTITWRELKA